MNDTTATTDLAAALLRDVPRYELNCHSVELEADPQGVWLHEAEVLSALSRALDPALTERAGEVLERLRWHREHPVTGDMVYRNEDGPDASDLITALLAQIAVLQANTVKTLNEADREYSRKTNDLIERHAEQLAALRAERDDALTFLDNAVSKAPEPLKALGKYLAGRLDEDEWPTAEQYLNAAAKACADRTDAAEAKVEKLRGACLPLQNLDMWTESAEDTEMVIVSVGTIRAIRAALTTEERK